MRKGFKNIGNTCFLNSVIELLLTMDDVRGKILESFPAFTQEYHSHLKFYNPVPFVRYYLSINKDYRLGQLGDAQECLTYFLSDFCEKISNDYNFVIHLQQTCIYSKNPHEKSVSESTVNILDVSFNTDILSSIQQYFEERNSEFIKQQKIYQYPKYLIVALKRFYNNLHKIDDPSTVQLHIKIDAINYNLLGFIVHSGKDLDTGHYFFCVKEELSWIIIDDDRTYIIESSQVPKYASYGYIFLYEKQ
jgi:ubiquitin C-terminal hydrolase